MVCKLTAKGYAVLGREPQTAGPPGESGAKATKRRDDPSRGASAIG